MYKVFALATLAITFAFSFPLVAELLPTKNSVHMRVIDTGAGLATLIEIQNDTNENNRISANERYFIVYDTGHWHTQKPTAAEISSRIPPGEQIDLMIISHPDSDHLAATDEIINGFTIDGLEYPGVRVDTIMRTGYQRPHVGNWADMQRGIRDATAQYGTRDVNLKYDHVPHGTKWVFGDTTVTLLAGFSEPPSDWDLGVPRSDARRYESRRRNAISIIVRLDYKGKSILFTGDAVGRKDGPPANSRSLATEKYLIDNKTERPIRSRLITGRIMAAQNASLKK